MKSIYVVLVLVITSHATKAEDGDDAGMQMYDTGTGSDDNMGPEYYAAAVKSMMKSSTGMFSSLRKTKEVIDDNHFNLRCVKELSKEVKKVRHLTSFLMKKVRQTLIEFTTKICEDERYMWTCDKLTHCKNMNYDDTKTLDVYEMFSDI